MLKNPSPGVSHVKVNESLALAGRAMKSSKVNPVTFPAECLPTLLILFSLPWSFTNLK